MTRALSVGVASALALVGLGCGVQPQAPVDPGPHLTVTSNPYAEVVWATDQWLKVELHDHAGTDTTKIRAYDRAGYGAFSLMTYSGVDSLPYSWRERRWPISSWLPAGFRASLGSIKVWLPNAEEIGYDHLMSPFMDGYVRRSTTPGDAGYADTQQCIDQITAGGGLAILAHPWTGVRRLAKLTNLFGVEIYNAFAEYRRVVTRDSAFLIDRNAQLLANWDTLLTADPAVRGIAVNDHFGPDNSSPQLPPSIRDSGKITALVGTADLETLRRALVAGRFFAIRDWSALKDGFPRLDSLHVDALAIEVFGATGAVRWIGNGRVVREGARLSLTTLPAELRYVRGEIIDSVGSVLYTQAFGLAVTP